MLYGTIVYRLTYLLLWQVNNNQNSPRDSCLIFAEIPMEILESVRKRVANAQLLIDSGKSKQASYQNELRKQKKNDRSDVTPFLAAQPAKSVAKQNASPHCVPVIINSTVSTSFPFL